MLQGYAPDSPGAIDVWGAGLENAERGLVVLHGRGQPPAALLAMVRRWPAEGLCALVPAADRLSWYPGRHDDRGAANLAAIDAAVARTALLVELLADSGVERARIGLLGFSQGAALACETVARLARPIGGLVSLTGCRTGGPGAWTETTGLDGTRVLMTGAHDDPWVTVEATLATAAHLRRRGASVETLVTPAGPHGVPPAHEAAARALVERL